VLILAKSVRKKLNLSQSGESSSLNQTPAPLWLLQ
jgi:hypothetical protein